MSYLCLFADPNIGRSPSPIYHVVQNACWQEYETACIAGLSYLQIAKCICSNCKVYLSSNTYHACWGEYETKQLVLLASAD